MAWPESEKNLVAVAAFALTDVPFEGWWVSDYLETGVCSFYHVEFDPAS